VSGCAHPSIYAATNRTWSSRSPTEGPSPDDHRKSDSNHHLICHGNGIRLKVITKAANVNDVTQGADLGWQLGFVRQNKELLLSVKPVGHQGASVGLTLRGYGGHGEREHSALNKLGVFFKRFFGLGFGGGE
jgi:hypothetical protein